MKSLPFQNSLEKIGPNPKKTSKLKILPKIDNLFLTNRQVPWNKKTSMYVTSPRNYEIWFQKSFFPQKIDFFVKRVEQFQKKSIFLQKNVKGQNARDRFTCSGSLF